MESAKNKKQKKKNKTKQKKKTVAEHGEQKSSLYKLCPLSYQVITVELNASDFIGFKRKYAFILTVITLSQSLAIELYHSCRAFLVLVNNVT